MKKIFKLGIIIICLFIFTGCNKKTNQKEQKEFYMGDTISIKNFDITFLNYSIRKAIGSNEKHQDLVFLEVNLKNTSKKEQRFTNSSYKVFGPDNTELDIISNSKYTTSLNNVGNIRSDGTTSGHLIFEYAGYGKYYLEFVNTKGSKVTLILDIYENIE